MLEDIPVGAACRRHVGGVERVETRRAANCPTAHRTAHASAPNKELPGPNISPDSEKTILENRDTQHKGHHDYNPNVVNTS